MLDPRATARAMARLRGPCPEPEPAAFSAELQRLSPREAQILDLIVEGLTNRQITERLFLKEKTVKNLSRRSRPSWGWAAVSRRRCSSSGCGAVSGSHRVPFGLAALALVSHGQVGDLVLQPHQWPGVRAVGGPAVTPPSRMNSVPVE